MSDGNDLAGQKNYHYQCHYPQVTAQVCIHPLFADAKGDSEVKKFELSVTSASPWINTLLQELGPLLVKLLPLILNGLLGGNQSDPPQPPSPSPADNA